MLLRPVNAVFINSKMKCIVVYQNGELWQLPRMKIDMESWERRESYSGSEDSLYLSRQQKITDPKLAELLPTEHLPKNIHGITLTKFKYWWLNNSYEWLKNNQDDNIQQEKTESSIASIVAGNQSIVTNNQSTANQSTNKAKSSTTSSAPTKPKMPPIQKQSTAQSIKIPELPIPSPSKKQSVAPITNKPKRELTELGKKALLKKQAEEKAKKQSQQPMTKTVKKTPEQVEKLASQPKQAKPATVKPANKTGDIFDDILANLDNL